MNQEYEIKLLEKQDTDIFKKLISLFHKVFEVEKTTGTEDAYLINLLENPDFIIICIILENEVVGGLTAYVLKRYYAAYSEVYIYDIAVEPTFQRTGLGKKLIAFLALYCTQKGIACMFVQANEEDKHAIDFYHGTGGKAEKVIYFNYPMQSKK